MLISIRHVTRYSYAEPPRYGIQSLRLTPPDFQGQRVLSWTIEAPGMAAAARFSDGWGNLCHLVTWTQSEDGLAIVAAGNVETEDRAGVAQGLPDRVPLRVFLRTTPLTNPDEALRELAAATRGSSTLDRLHALMHRVREKIDYQVGATGAHTSAAEALRNGVGVCQDHAHVFIAAARCLGLPARYVNGYFVTGGDEHAEAHHAWAEVWVESLGWVGFDPSNLSCPTASYVRLAWGLDAPSAAPIRGTLRGGSEEALDVTVEVQQQSAQQ